MELYDEFGALLVQFAYVPKFNTNNRVVQPTCGLLSFEDEES
jgi:hypothetical protein